mgnify:CR=1 FL=1
MSKVTPQQVAAAIDARADDARGWLMDTIAFESTQGNEAGVQEYMKNLLDDIGMKAEYRPISDEIFNDPEYSHNENEMSYEGRPNVIDLMKNREIAMIINTSSGKKTREDTAVIRSTAVFHSVPLVTTLSGAQAAVNAIKAVKTGDWSVKTIQEYHRDI